MKKIELLAPAGDKECFKAAVYCGTDAIYIGGQSFSARASAQNFNKEDIQWAVSFAHTYGVKVYVTVNTLYKDSEFSELLAYIDFLYQIQIDALIIQDLGLFMAVRKIYPDFELHMSTQASIMNVQGVQYFAKMGAQRIVLARENSLEEISEIVRKTKVEIEVFVHGALCICYSGQCLMSSMIGKRSGNRGSCAQPCRLKYRLMKDNILLEDKYPYLLSPRDLMSIEHIDQLIKAGIHSLKIEGRMKRPEYVASTILAYRQAIDSYYDKLDVSFNNEIYDMTAMFNRQYTSGYLFHDKHIVDGDYSGNKGIIIGQVMAYNKKLKRVKIKLTGDINQGDSIVFESIDKGRPVNKIYKAGHLVNHASSQDIIEVEFDTFVKNGLVRKTVDTKVIKKLQQTYQKPRYKQAVNMILTAQINHPLTLTISLNNFSVTCQASVKVEPAIKTPTNKQRLIEQLSKLGQTPFKINEIQIIMDDNISIPIKEINALRREACHKLEKLLSQQKIHHMFKQNIDYPIKKDSQKGKTYVYVSNLEQLKSVINYHDIEIIYPYQSDVIEAYHIYPDMILGTARILKSKDIEDIKNSSIYSLIDKIFVDNYGAYEAFNDKNLILGTGMNIYNSMSVSHYSDMKILSVEMTLDEINNLYTDLSKCIIQVYGKIENMISEYCPISNYYFGYLKKNCQICRNHTFSIIDRKGEKFDIQTDEYCRMHLLNCRSLLFDQYSSALIKNHYLHFTNENNKEVMLIMDYFIKENHDINKIKKQLSLTHGYY
ncbi:MAG: DUF3656 domain-containing protein [Erysipelotrichaceae bacterium]|nr:DUF3656 domain-containing protein [Erysipelotrichaceae bacterium]